MFQKIESSSISHLPEKSIGFDKSSKKSGNASKSRLSQILLKSRKSSSSDQSENESSFSKKKKKSNSSQGGFEIEMV